MKHWDEARHVAGTGVSNRAILDNLRRAAVSGREVLPRIPVIPGYNDAPADADGFRRLLREAGLSRGAAAPLPPVRREKIRPARRAYAYSGADALHEEDLEDYRRRFLDGGIDAFF